LALDGVRSRDELRGRCNHSDLDHGKAGNGLEVLQVQSDDAEAEMHSRGSDDEIGKSMPIPRPICSPCMRPVRRAISSVSGCTYRQQSKPRKHRDFGVSRRGTPSSGEDEPTHFYHCLQEREHCPGEGDRIGAGLHRAVTHNCQANKRSTWRL
jgi:hypothetical protein